MRLSLIDQHIIYNLRRYDDTLARLAMFVIFVWFGGLKLIGLSPANDLVEMLLQATLPFIPFSFFIVLLGILEVSIGILFLIKRTEKAAIILLIPHMIATFGPLVFLPEIAWQMPLVPTLEGQYIIKNLAIIALAMGILSYLYESTPKNNKQ